MRSKTSVSISDPRVIADRVSDPTFLCAACGWFRLLLCSARRAAVHSFMENLSSRTSVPLTSHPSGLLALNKTRQRPTSLWHHIFSAPTGCGENATHKLNSWVGRDSAVRCACAPSSAQMFLRSLVLRAARALSAVLQLIDAEPAWCCTLVNHASSAPAASLFIPPAKSPKYSCTGL